MVDVHVSPCEHGCASGVRVDVARGSKSDRTRLVDVGARGASLSPCISMGGAGAGLGLEVTFAAWMGRLERVLVTWVETAIDGWWEGR